MDLFTKRYIFNYDIQNKKILLKLDLESPIYDNKIINDYKIKRNLPLLLKLLQNNCSVIILTYNGDNNNKIISETIQEYLHDYKVEYLNKNYGIDVEQKATNIQNSILVLENTKFVSKELSNEQLASF
jgi:phosphoglycerate kinase